MIVPKLQSISPFRNNTCYPLAILEDLAFSGIFFGMLSFTDLAFEIIE